jgi:hypothetical protein
MKAKLTDTEVAVEQAQQWADELQEVKELIGDRFSRSEARERALTYLRGLMSPAERKNGWQLADGASGFPTLMLLDKTGMVKKAWTGKLSSERESEVLDSIKCTNCG